MMLADAAGCGESTTLRMIAGLEDIPCVWAATFKTARSHDEGFLFAMRFCFCFCAQELNPERHNVSLNPLPLTAAGISELGEGPVWDDRNQCFYWVDINPGRIHEFDPASTSQRTWELDSTVGFAVPTLDSSHWLIGKGTSVVSLDVATGVSTDLVTLNHDASMRCNDGKCDPTGRLWAGVMPSDWGAMTGSLYSMTGGNDVRHRLGEIGCSNGLAWDQKKERFYYIDSLKHRIDHFHWNADSGDIRFARTLAKFTDEDGLPDGMCIDAEGQLWVAFWNGECVRRIDTESGDRISQIDLPARQITSCCFGGPNLDTLYITSAWAGLSEADRKSQPLAGSVFTVKPGVHGLPVDRFDRSVK